LSPVAVAGDHSLFVWVSALRDHVAGDEAEYETSAYQRREPSEATPHYPTSGSHSERLDYSAAYQFASFEDLSARTVSMAATVGEPYGSLLRMLGSCYPAGVDDVAGYRAQHVGASYRQLAYIAHLAGMTGAERSRWYRIAESVPLSQRHAGHLIKELQARGGGYAA
jgi:hypothetical protein